MYKITSIMNICTCENSVVSSGRGETLTRTLIAFSIRKTLILGRDDVFQLGTSYHAEAKGSSPVPEMDSMIKAAAHLEISYVIPE